MRGYLGRGYKGNAAVKTHKFECGDLKVVLMVVLTCQTMDNVFLHKQYLI